MFKVVTLTALIFIVTVALLRFVHGKNRAHDRYIQRDYEKLKRLDAQLQQEKNGGRIASTAQHPDDMP